jgi:hypothetical protein
MAGLVAFQDAFMSGNTLDGKDFSDFEARRLRYEIMWALYENTVFRNVHKWADAYKSEYGLYKFIRNVYNPAYRIGEFWKGHLYGGQLDPAAGDGKKAPSVMPIITDNDQLRPALATLWRDSNWQIQKDILSLWGPVLGDSIIRVIDDPVKGRVSLRITHPGTLKNVTLDPWGNVKGYVIEENRHYDDGTKKIKVYREECERDGDYVVYKTFLDDKPWSELPGEPNEWEEAYGFVPMIKVMHNNVGLDWGWSELFPGIGKFREVDDLASKLSDQVRKMVDAPWLLSGVDSPANNPKTRLLGGATGIPGAKVTSTPEVATNGRRNQKGREEVPTLYAGPGANAIALVAPLSISETSAYIESILKDIEKDYPELAINMQNVQGDISGRALRINQQPVTEKVMQRRANYDDAVVRAQQMAIAIGGFRKYKGYEGFNLDSFKAGKLDHSIGARPVFGRDPLDDLDLEAKLWEVAKQAKDADIPIDIYLERQNWEQKYIDRVLNSPAYKAKLEALNNLSNPPDPANLGGIKNRFSKTSNDPANNPDDNKAQ